MREQAEHDRVGSPSFLVSLLLPSYPYPRPRLPRPPSSPRPQGLLCADPDRRRRPAGRPVRRVRGAVRLRVLLLRGHQEAVRERLPRLGRRGSAVRAGAPGLRGLQGRCRPAGRPVRPSRPSADRPGPGISAKSNFSVPMFAPRDFTMAAAGSATPMVCRSRASSPSTRIWSGRLLRAPRQVCGGCWVGPLVDGVAIDTASSTSTANTSTWEQRIHEPLLLF